MTHSTGFSRLLARRERPVDGVGEVVETLKWGQAAYLTEKPKSGSTIRLGTVKGHENGYAMFFHCQTTLVSTFREIYPETLSFQGKRAILFSLDVGPRSRRFAYLRQARARLGIRDRVERGQPLVVGGDVLVGGEARRHGDFGGLGVQRRWIAMATNRAIEVGVQRYLCVGLRGTERLIQRLLLTLHLECKNGSTEGTDSGGQHPISRLSTDLTQACFNLLYYSLAFSSFKKKYQRQPQ